MIHSPNELAHSSIKNTTSSKELINIKYIFRHLSYQNKDVRFLVKFRGSFFKESLLQCL